MSKQVKLKFKKLVKQAEFVHADLDYHTGLLSEAKQKFLDRVNEVLNSLSPEERKVIEEFQKEKNLRALAEKEAQDSVEEEFDELEDESLTVAVVEDDGDGFEVDPALEPTDIPEVKASALKKLFYKIADLTHPDKTAARGKNKLEVKQLEKIFKNAQSAYSSGNWYVLYTIALDLDIQVEDPSEEQIAWIEEDIKGTLGKISQIGSLIAWAWYTGNPIVKHRAVQSYFKQSFGFDI